MARIDSRKARRMMKQMGMQMDELGDVKRVILQSPTREIVIDGPMVTAINVQGQKMYQIAGGKTTERAPQAAQVEEKKQVEVSDEDVLLVSQQANVSMEKARATLIQVEGDLAKAILMLQK